MKAPQIKPSGKTVPDAYHGTSKDIAVKIKHNGFTPSEEDDYLGNGVYFFESSEWHAQQWARKKYSEIGVICAEIELGNCLELYKKEHQDLIKDTCKEVQKKLGLKNLKDGIIINWITRDFKVKVDTVKALYTIGGSKKIFPGSHFYEDTVMMICVKNLSNIVRFSITYSGV
jgi:hypothetical protein